MRLLSLFQCSYAIIKYLVSNGIAPDEAMKGNNNVRNASHQDEKCEPDDDPNNNNPIHCTWSLLYRSIKI